MKQVIHHRQHQEITHNENDQLHNKNHGNQMSSIVLATSRSPINSEMNPRINNRQVSNL